MLCESRSHVLLTQFHTLAAVAAVATAIATAIATTTATTIPSAPSLAATLAIAVPAAITAITATLAPTLAAAAVAASASASLRSYDLRSVFSVRAYVERTCMRQTKLSTRKLCVLSVGQESSESAELPKKDTH